MGFRMSKMSITKLTNPRKFEDQMHRAITKHGGVGLHIAQDLDVGISTFKRWVEENPGLVKLMVQVRKAKRKSKPKAA